MQQLKSYELQDLEFHAIRDSSNKSLIIEDCLIKDVCLHPEDVGYIFVNCTLTRCYTYVAKSDFYKLHEMCFYNCTIENLSIQDEIFIWKDRFTGRFVYNQLLETLEIRDL